MLLRRERIRASWTSPVLLWRAARSHWQERLQLRSWQLLETSLRDQSWMLGWTPGTMIISRTSDHSNEWYNDCCQAIIMILTRLLSAFLCNNKVGSAWSMIHHLGSISRVNDHHLMMHCSSIKYCPLDVSAPNMTSDSPLQWSAVLKHSRKHAPQSSFLQVFITEIKIWNSPYTGILEEQWFQWIDSNYCSPCHCQWTELFAE